MSKDEKVSVEMSKEQKEKVVAVLAKEENKKKTVKVQLYAAHNRNGVAYGPGFAVEVPAEIAGSLIAADHNAVMARLKENQSSDKLIEIIGRGISRTVR
jgi:hypothetical protein